MTGLLLTSGLVLLALFAGGLAGWAWKIHKRPDPFPQDFQVMVDETGAVAEADVMDEIRSTGPLPRIKAH